MKNLIIIILENICKQYNIEQPTQNDIGLVSLEEFCDVAQSNKKQVSELWGDFDFVLMFADHPDYAFIKMPCSPEIITKIIFSWLKEINLIKE